MEKNSVKDWMQKVIIPEENQRFMQSGNDFVDEEGFWKAINENKESTKAEIRDIIQKSLSIKPLTINETAKLLNVTDPDLWEEINEAAIAIKQKVYDNRIVFFAPLYCSNLCVNNCAYCGFRADNIHEKRRILTLDEVRRETEYVLDNGHKRIIMVYGEHPRSDVHYMAETIQEVYSVERNAPKSGRVVGIRRVNVNAAPMGIDDLKILKASGIGTYQVFQETYHRATYANVHPVGTLKSDYHWRLYSLHRAQEAGIDDVAVGALFGLYDWRFEVLGLVAHAADMERFFGVGPHTVSVPRITPASGSLLSNNSKYLVSDEDFKKLVAVIRLALPYPGLIITAREKPAIKRKVIKLGCTQTDASTKIGIGAYQECNANQELNTEQFTIGDSRSLDEIIREVGEMGMISSFCTAGYRCGRTGDKIMGMLKHCVEGKFCKLNAVLTYREYLDDYASPETKAIGERLIEKEIGEIRNESFFMKNDGRIFNEFMKNYEFIKSGTRDLFI